MIIQRNGRNFAEVWEEGEEFIKIRVRLEELAKERDELEKIKRWKPKLPKTASMKAQEGNDDLRADMNEELDTAQ